MGSNPVSAEDAATASTTDLAAADAPAVEHDRAVTATGDGRVTFKGHNARAGYPWRIYEGRVEAYVDGAWVEAEDSQPVS